MPVNLLIVLSTNVKVVKKEDLFTLWPFNAQVKFFSNTIINEWGLVISSFCKLNNHEKQNGPSINLFV